MSATDVYNTVKKLLKDGSIKLTFMINRDLVKSKSTNKIEQQSNFIFITQVLCHIK
jgi:hypothetical protein